jgi:DNA-binding NarL/FixJ family response regulator
VPKLSACYQQNLPGGSQAEGGYGVRRGDTSQGQPIGKVEIAVRIAHSDPVITAGLAVLLRKRRGFKVLRADAKRSTLHRAGGRVDSADVVIADCDSGVWLTAGAAELNGRVIILSHDDSPAKICHALAQGVRGYLLLGCSVQDLVAGIRSVHEGGVAVTPRVASRIAESMHQETLTTREQSVLQRMALGLRNKRIASELGLAEGTIKTHVKSILDKLNASNRSEAIAIARRRGILRDELEWQERPCARGLSRPAKNNVGATPRNAAPAQASGSSSGTPS